MTDKPKRVIEEMVINGAMSDTSNIILSKEEISHGRMFTNKQLTDCLLLYIHLNQDLESKLEIAREALGMYANPDSWAQTINSVYNLSGVWVGVGENGITLECGKRARTALKELEE